MDFTIRNQKILLFLLPVVAFIIGILWFIAFPLNTPFDLQDVIIEGLILCAAAGIYIYTRKIGNEFTEFGLMMYVIGLWIDFLDEFTKEPDLINTQIEGALIIGGLFLLAYGMYHLHSRYKSDLAQAKEREKKLKMSETRFRRLIANIAELICEIDAEGHITYISPKSKKLLGFEPEELVGKTLQDLRNQEEMQDLEISIEEILADKASFSFFNLPLLHSSGRSVVMEISGTPVTEGGVFSGYHIVCRDVTDKKKVEDALRLTNQKLKLLSDITRHDVLNQVMVLHGYMEIARDHTDDQALIGLFDKEQHAIRLIGDLISFTKTYEEIGAGAPRWQKVRYVVKTASQKSMFGDVTLDIDPGDVGIYADPLLEQVFHNLFENALRYGEGITRISITGEERPDGYVIICEDDGTGIPDGEKERIFSRQYGRNTGLGLFLAKEILGITGIEISETGTYGKGARFELLVPRGSYRFENDRF